MGSHQPNKLAGLTRVYTQPQTRTIETIKGPITPPLASIPRRSMRPVSMILTQKMAKAIENRWACGGNFTHLADAIIDVLCEHIAKSSTEKMDARISDAIEDHMSVEPKEVDIDAEHECSTDDIATATAEFRRRTLERLENYLKWNGGAM